MTSNGSKRLRFNAYEVDLATGELWKRGVAVKLAGQPFQILAYLVRRPGQLVHREELRAELWPGETFVDFDHGLNAAVNKLRLVLCDSAENPKYIETLPRRGYRFLAAVEEIPGAVTVAVPAAQEPEERGEVPPSSHGRQMASRAFWKRALWLPTAVVASLLLAGFWLFGGRVQTGANPRKAVTAPRPATALISLTSLSDRTSQPAFSPDGSRVAFVRDGAPGSSGIWSKQVSGDEFLQLTKDEGDCCPVWSPDGHWLAFSRASAVSRKVYKVAARGGEIRELFATGVIAEHAELGWSRDGKNIAYVAQGAEGSSAIFLHSLDMRPGEERRDYQVTEPSAPEQDWGPAFSPDGNRLAFVRGQNIMVLSLEGKEIQHLIRTPGHILSSPAWTPDGQSIVFASSNGDGPNLMRVSASGGKATAIPEAGGLALNPAISKRGFRLACDQLTVASSIDQIDLSRPADSSRRRALSRNPEKARTLVASQTGENGGVQISHEGTRLVFQSNRTGESEVWISDRDGENPIRITAIGTASAPAWSPDDKEIAFEAGSRSSAGATEGILLVKANGGEAWPLVQDGFNNRAPRWSNDGKWIYFGSNRSGDWQIWKIAAWGGAAVRVTHQGGLAAEESLDGKYLFYVKQDGKSVEMWKMEIAGGPETRVSPAIHPLDWAAWTLAQDGLLFVESGAGDEALVSLLDFASARVKRLAVLDKPPFWMAATRDGRSVIFDQAGQFESHVALLEDFR